MIKIFEFLCELVGWVRIVLSPLLIGLAIGAIIYFYKQDDIGLVCGISIALIGLIAGVILACRAWKKNGTITFLSRIMSSPKLDQKEVDKKNKVPNKNSKE